MIGLAIGVTSKLLLPKLAVFSIYISLNVRANSVGQLHCDKATVMREVTLKELTWP